MEMNHNPRETFSYILAVYGVDAAQRLYDQWWRTVPRVDAVFAPLWEAGHYMEDELRKSTPSASPSTAS
jgi:hypothetical protein